MEFNQSTIRRFLTDAIPSRFQYLSPDEFNAFVAHVFEVDGYEVEELAKKAESGYYLMARKEDLSMIIKSLRYPPEHKINVDEIQKAAAARIFHQTDQAWIITTSSFTDVAKKEADKLDVELWDWDAFYQALTQLFFEGKSHFEFVDVPALTQQNVEISNPEIKLKVNWQPVEGVSVQWYNLEMVISNNSDRNVYLHLDLPALIDKKKNQVMADLWADNEFVAGLIYNGASIRTNALFKAAKLGESPPGGKIMLTCHERTEPPSTYHLSARIKGSACYFVTYCYSRDSEAYRLMIDYRDHHLSKSISGRMFISLYYFISPWLVRFAPKLYILDYTIKKVTETVIRMVRKRYS
ncbi:MAG TPA: restriction endonuclease [Saprospiraceae bacterium]|nr:restriction endonuclease [Saprospiraceae bacterium]